MRFRGPLPLQHESALTVASSIVRTPSAPESIGRLAVDLAHGVFAVAATSAGRTALEELHRALFAVLGREREASSLWHESLATAAYGELLARLGRASVAVVTLGALLHGAADAWMLRAFARSELQNGAPLDGPSRSRISAREAAACASRIVREWKLPTPVAACVLGWRECGEISSVTPEAQVVYCARLLAIELLQPRMCVPGSVAAAAAEHGFDDRALARVRAGEGRVRELIRAFA